LTPKKSPTMVLTGYTLAAILCWTLLMIGLATWNLHGLRKDLLAAAKSHAQAVLSSDLVYQRQLAVQGGFYAPLSDKIQPNPLFSQLKNRDFTTTSGIKLTLIMPRYMSSDMHQLVFGQFGYKGHMTSLKPLRPKNLPDEWEKKALNTFTGGTKEVAEIAKIDGVAYLRLMQPLLIRKRCLICHPRQENQVNKSMGGISLAVPLAPLWVSQREQQNKLMMTYLLIWLIGIIGVGLGNLHLGHYLRGWGKAEKSLRVSEEALNRAQEVAQIGSWHLDLANNETTWSKQIYRIFDISPGTPLTYELILANVHPEDRQEVDDAWQAALAGQPFEIEHRIIVNLQLKWVRNKVGVEFDPTGRAIGITGIFWDITGHKKATQQIKTAEEKWRRTFDSVDDIIAILEPDLTVRKLNQAAINLLDKPKTELIGNKCYELFRNGEKPCPGCPILKTITDGEHRSIEITHKNLNKTFLVSAAPMYDNSGQVTDIAHFARDITEQKTLSAQLLQSQKMEGIGRLAGGVAHDFNNILTVINGRAELTLMSTKNDNPLRGALQEIIQAGERAASFTRQLLAFSRKQVIRPKSVNINSVVTNLGKMLRRLIGEDIELENQLEENLPPVLADPVQLEQIIVNLVVNAADAVHSLSTTRIGKIIISTALCNFDQAYINQHNGCRTGPHIQLGVSDNGIGIPPEVKDKIFEPFFTTKEQGKGTGLGLATVYGIIKQNRGSVYMDSQPEVGTTFLVNWPVTRIQEIQDDLGNEIKLMEGNGTILLAEDEEKLRELVTESLQRAGYQVLAAADGNEAIDLAKNHNGRLDLLFTDLVMPGINGLETARQVTVLRPEIKVLYTSGYISDRLELREVDKNLLLDKPYTLPVLTAKIKEVINAKTTAES